MHRKNIQGDWPIAISAFFFIALPLVVYPISQHATQADVTFTVEKAERVFEADSSRYLIFTKAETFEDTDSIVFLKFNSSDLYGRIDQGKTYRAKVAGLRIPFLS